MSGPDDEDEDEVEDSGNVLDILFRGPSSSGRVPKRNVVKTVASSTKTTSSEESTTRNSGVPKSTTSQVTKPVIAHHTVRRVGGTEAYQLCKPLGTVSTDTQDRTLLDSRLGTSSAVGVSVTVGSTVTLDSSVHEAECSNSPALAQSFTAFKSPDRTPVISCPQLSVQTLNLPSGINEGQLLVVPGPSNGGEEPVLHFYLISNPALGSADQGGITIDETLRGQTFYIPTRDNNGQIGAMDLSHAAVASDGIVTHDVTGPCYASLSSDEHCTSQTSVDGEIVHSSTVVDDDVTGCTQTAVVSGEAGASRTQEEVTDMEVEAAASNGLHSNYVYYEVENDEEIEDESSTVTEGDEIELASDIINAVLQEDGTLVITTASSLSLPAKVFED